jgi:conjugal transfer mating pair stabilization protein TraN
MKLDAGLRTWQAASAAGQAVQGAWTALTDPAHQTWSAITRPFTAAAESIFGTGGEIAGQAGAQSLSQAMMQHVGQWVYSTFGEAAFSALFSGSTTGGSVAVTGWSAAVGTALSVVSVVLWAYLVYQVAVILVRLIWKCEKQEFELAVKRELKSCHYVGSYCASDVLGVCIEKRTAYCCFASPLSRLVQEQIRPQLGMDWGRAKRPNCAGVPVDRLDEIDWSAVNLDEWLGLLAETGNLPTVDPAAMLDMERLTGRGNRLNTGHRDNALERNTRRTEAVDADAVRRNVHERLWSF